MKSLCPQYAALPALLAASIHPHTQWGCEALVRQTVVLVYTVLLNGSPVYEWSLNIIGWIHGQAYISWIHVRRDKSPPLEFWSVTLYTWHHTHQFGVWSAASTDELGLHFLVFPCEFQFLRWSAAASLHSSEIQSQIRGFMQSDTKNYSNAIHKTSAR